jgi:hypothetical protein
MVKQFTAMIEKIPLPIMLMTVLGILLRCMVPDFLKRVSSRRAFLLSSTKWNLSGGKG